MQRKAEQKREIERKRAAQQEDVRRQEQLHRQEAERQRERERSAAIDDPKKIAQKQAIEKRRLELERKNQQRAPQRPGNEAVSLRIFVLVYTSHLIYATGETTSSSGNVQTGARRSKTPFKNAYRAGSQ